jgi:hypothetical protein
VSAPIPATRRKSDKVWRDALIRALARRSEDGGFTAGLDVVADQVIQAASEGDKDAWKEIGDRLDGKPKQQTEITGGEDADGNAIPASINVNFKR